MSLVIRPHHWFFALILSALMHGWVIYSVHFFELQSVERVAEELPFTVLLSDQEVVEQVVLEDPEAASSDVIPLVSLDEGEQEEIKAVEVAAEVTAEVTAEITASGDSLELVSAGDAPEVVTAETEEVALADQPEMSAPSEHMLKLLENEEFTPPESATVPSLSSVTVLTPESLAQMSAMESAPTEVLELEPEVVAPVDPMPEVVDLAEVEEMVELAIEEEGVVELAIEEEGMVELAIEEEGVDLTKVQEVPLQPQLEMPEVSRQSEVILAEITIEQIEFDEETFNSLPEVKAEDWKPELPSMSAKKGKEWKRRYAGARGISAKYRKQMRSTLTQFVLYPKAVAEEQRVEGKVVVGFTINREGRLEDTEILESSGFPALDQAVEKMVEFAQPFTQLPATVKNDKVRFAFPVTIKLKR